MTKKFYIGFPSLPFGRLKTCNTTSGGLQCRTKMETGDSEAVTSILEREFVLVCMFQS